MAENNSYHFSVDVEIAKALRKIQQVDSAVGRLGNKKENNNDILNQNEYNNVARDMGELAEMVDKVRAGMDEARKASKSMEDAFKFAGATTDMKMLERQLKRVSAEYRNVGKGLKTTQSKQYDSNRYIAGQKRPDDKYRGIGKNESKTFQERINAETSKVKRLSGTSERFIGNIKGSGYLNSMDMQKTKQTMAQLKSLQTSVKANHQSDITKREDELKQGDKRLQQLQRKGSMNEEERKEMNAIIEKNNQLMDEIKALEKFQRTVERTTQQLKELERLTGIKTPDSAEDLAKMQGGDRKLEQVKPERGTALGMAYERAPSLAMGITAVTAGVVGSAYNKGESLKNAMLDDNLSLGTQTGNFNYHQVRENQELLGLDRQVNMSGTEALKAQAEYMNRAGYTSQSDLNDAVRNTGTFSHGMGVSISDATENTSTLAQYMNGANSSSIKQMQSAFAGGLKASGMVGQNKQQLSALDTLVSTIGETTSLDKNDITQLMGMQSALASTGEKTLQGEAGAKLLTDLNAGMQGISGNALAVSLAQQGDPARYATGMAGSNQLEYDASKGVTGEAFQAILKGSMRQVQRIGGTDEQQAGMLAKFMKEAMNVQMNGQQAKGMIDLYNKGSLDPEEIQRVMEANASDGEKTISDNASKYSQSATATETNYSSAKDRQATDLNDLATPAKQLVAPLYGMGGALSIAIPAIAGFTGALLSASASMLAGQGLRNIIGGRTASSTRGGGAGGGGRGIGRFFGGGGGGGTGGGGAGGAGGGLLRGAGKAVPVVGTAVALGGGYMAYNQAGKEHELGLTTDKEYKEDVGSAIGSTGGVIGGASAGALAGATIGSAVPVVGTAIGGLAGGAIGAFGGSKLGGWLGSKVGGWFGKDEETKKENTSNTKKEEASTEKKLTAEQERANNITRDEKFVKEYRDAMNKQAGGTTASRQGVDGEGGTATSTDTESTDTSVNDAMSEPAPQNTATESIVPSIVEKNNLASATPTSATRTASTTGAVKVEVTHNGEVSTISKGGQEFKTAIEDTTKYRAVLPSGNQFKFV